MARVDAVRARACRRSSCSLVLCLVLLALAAGPGLSADKPAPAGPSGQEALERFRKLSPEERLRRAEKVAGGAAFVPVKRGELEVIVVERGELGPAEASDIVCPLKARSSNSTVAATIKWVVEDGTFVKKGARLVELDDSGLREQLAFQKINRDKARSDRAYAEAQLKIVRAQNKLDVRRAEIDLKAARRALKKYRGDNADEKEALEDMVELAQLSLDTVKLQIKAKEGTADADLKMKAALEAEEVKREREIEGQIAACVVKSPRSGLVVYEVPDASPAKGGGPIVAEGEPVREGQKLLRVCDLKKFVVDTKVHEALIARVRVGQAATVGAHAFPKLALRGRVKSVSAVASRRDWRSAGVKAYPVVVELTEQFPGLKPGMSAEVRIEVERRPKVLQVPVGAVLRIGKDVFCYVKEGQGLQERRVKTGARSDSSVEIVGGMKEGEQVLRSPRAVIGPLPLPPAKGAKGAPR
jgi:multidrug efflux pump subunit AcrA (membrane-fusion protein)